MFQDSSYKYASTESIFPVEAESALMGYTELDSESGFYPRSRQSVPPMFGTRMRKVVFHTFWTILSLFFFYPMTQKNLEFFSKFFSKKQKQFFF